MLPVQLLCNIIDKFYIEKRIYVIKKKLKILNIIYLYFQ